MVCSVKSTDPCGASVLQDTISDQRISKTNTVLNSYMIIINLFKLFKPFTVYVENVNIIKQLDVMTVQN